MKTKRKQFADQFELIVKQEIINRERAIESYQLRLNDLSELFDRLCQEMRQSQVQLKDELHRLRQQQDKLQGQNQDHEHGLSCSEYNHKKLKKDIEDIHSHLEDLDARLHAFWEHFRFNGEDLKAMIAELKDAISKGDSAIELQCNRLGMLIDGEVKSLKYEIASSPSRASQKIADLANAQNAQQMQFLHLKQEHELLKKREIYKTKQIEDLYNQIAIPRNKS